MYRIEIYLPLFYNDGRPIESGKFDITRKELIKKFDGLTAMQANPDFALEGWWVNQGLTYRDKIVVFRIDSPELNKRFWARYKTVLKRRFVQEEIYITSVELNRL